MKIFADVAGFSPGKILAVSRANSGPQNQLQVK